MRLAEARVRKVLSTMGMAKKAGVAYKTALNLEKGRLTPSMGTISKIAGALDVDPWDVDEFRAVLDRELGKAQRVPNEE